MRHQTLHLLQCYFADEGQLYLPEAQSGQSLQKFRCREVVSLQLWEWSSAIKYPCMRVQDHPCLPYLSLKFRQLRAVRGSNTCKAFAQLLRSSLAKRETDWLFSLLLSITELTSVRNLGFIIDRELNMKDHITKLCQSCYYNTSFVKYARFDTHSHHQPSKLWSMASSARKSISPTAFSMGLVPTSLTVFNRF